MMSPDYCELHEEEYLEMQELLAELAQMED